MKLLILSTLLLSTSIFASELHIENGQGTILYYADKNTKSCFIGDENELVSKINQGDFNDSDWGLTDGEVVNTDLIKFTFWDLPGTINTFLVNRCL